MLWEFDADQQVVIRDVLVVHLEMRKNLKDHASHGFRGVNNAVALRVPARGGV